MNNKLRNGIILSICFVMLIIPLCSAGGGLIDFKLNPIVKNYNPVLNEVTLKNSIIGIPTTEIAKVRLIDYNRYCFGDCYMYITIDSNQDGQALQDITYYDETRTDQLNDKTKNYEIYNPNTPYEVPIYQLQCNGNQSCSKVKTGIETKYGQWETYNPSQTLVAGQYDLRVKVDVEAGETVDVIPNLYGTDIDEWTLFTGMTLFERNDAAPVLTHGGYITNTHNSTQTFQIGMSGANQSFTVGGLSIYVGDWYNNSVIYYFAIYKANSTNTGCDMTQKIAYRDYSGPIAGGEADLWVNYTFSNTGILTRGGNYCIFVNSSQVYDGSDAVWGDYGGVDDYLGGVDDYGTTYDRFFQIWGNTLDFPISLYPKLISPLTNYNTTKHNVFFNSNASLINSNLTNATLIVFNGGTTLTNFTVVNGTFNTTNLSLSGLGKGWYNWSYLYCGINSTTTFCNSTTNRTLLILPYVENSQTYDTTSYKGFQSNFSINYTYDNSFYNSVISYLWYNGTKYLGTQTTDGINNISSKSLIVNDLGIKNLFWEFIFTNSTGNEEFNSTTNTQSVNSITFGICSGTNLTILNITFLDETTTTRINATMDTSSWIYGSGNNSFTFSNSTHNMEYDFCIDPSLISSLLVNAQLQFSKSEGGTYPQRKYNIISQTLVNTSVTNLTLYLLNYNNGITSSYNVQTVGGQVVQGAYLKFERQVNGVLTKVADGYTDSSGTLQVFLNPNYEHTLTVMKSGFLTQTQTLYPSQSTYTITLGTPGGYFNYNNSIEGISYTKWPPSGIVTYGMYNYTYSVYSLNNNIYNCSFLIKYTNGTQIASASGCGSILGSNGGTISTMVNTSNLKGQWVGQYFVTLTNNSLVMLEGDARWYLMNVSNRAYWTSFRSAINDSIGLAEWGDNPETNDYSRIVFFFIFFAIVLAILNGYTGYDTAYPGAFLYIITGVVILMSGINGVAGPGFFYLKGATNNNTFGSFSSVMDNWILAFHFLLLCLIYFFTTNKRYQAG